MKLDRYKQGIQLGAPCTADAQAGIILPMYMDTHVTLTKKFGHIKGYTLGEEIDNRITEVLKIGTHDYVANKGYTRDVKEYDNNIGVAFNINIYVGTRTYKDKVYMYDCYKLNIIYQGKALYYHVMHAYMKEMRKLVYRTIKEYKPKNYKQTKKRNVVHTYDRYYGEIDRNLKEYKGSVVDQAINKYDYIDVLPF